MNAPQHTVNPLVSVIITSFNHAKFLHASIGSVLAQTYSSIEIIVVDDGSTDDTAVVAMGYNGVRYYFQSNAGPSAARNCGIEQATGDYLIFLDADDILLAGAVELQVREIAKDPSLAFVSGGHMTSNEILEERRSVSSTVTSNEYPELLKGNYIGMIGAVIFRRSLLAHHRFDLTLKGCEDYDLYLRLAKEYKTCNHQGMIAVYRGHSASASKDYLMMLKTALLVLEKQRAAINSELERTAFTQGRKNWINFYSYMGYDSIASDDLEKPSSYQSQMLYMLRTYKPKLYIKYFINKFIPLSKVF